MEFEHTSVMPQEVYEYQNLKPGNICVDCTLGGAGHAQTTLKAILPGGKLIGIDQDLDAINHARKILQPFENQVLLNHSNFSELPQILSKNHIDGVHSILLDLGFSLNQIRNSNRGFSFKKEEPLDMRMDTRNKLTAFDIINSFQEGEMADLFFRFGEEKLSRRIARRIVQERTVSPIRTSMTLAGIIEKSVPSKQAHKQRIHPATRVFQALRIAVNAELEQLETFLKHAPSLLLKGGRLLIISFHSLEDRIVKQAFKNFESGCTCPPKLPICACGFNPVMTTITRKPVVPTKEEIEKNPMARSSKLRVAQKN